MVNITLIDDEDEPPTINVMDGEPTTTGIVADFAEIILPPGVRTNELNAVTLVADDDDAEANETITWSLSGPDAGDFTIEPSGDYRWRSDIQEGSQFREAC